MRMLTGTLLLRQSSDCYFFPCSALRARLACSACSRACDMCPCAEWAWVGCFFVTSVRMMLSSSFMVFGCFFGHRKISQ
jgi:hypothetical protein